MEDKYYWYLKWVYSQLNGGINASVPSKKCIMMEGKEHYLSKTLIGGYAAVDEIGLFYETILQDLYQNGYSEEDKRGICIHIVLHELSHLSQDCTYSSSDYIEMANDLNVLRYMKENDYDIRTKCGTYDLDIVEDMIMLRLKEYQEKCKTNILPIYRYIETYEERLQKYLESHLHSEIPDSIQTLQIRYFYLDKVYVIDIIKDGTKLSETDITNSLNYITHHNMMSRQTSGYRRLHMDQKGLYLDIVPEVLFEKLKSQNPYDSLYFPVSDV